MTLLDVDGLSRCDFIPLGLMMRLDLRNKTSFEVNANGSVLVLKSTKKNNAKFMLIFFSKPRQIITKTIKLSSCSQQSLFNEVYTLVNGRKPIVLSSLISDDILPATFSAGLFQD
jgi:hypothetical protein